jgi:hypothetical protein
VRSKKKAQTFGFVHALVDSADQALTNQGFRTPVKKKILTSLHRLKGAKITRTSKIKLTYTETLFWEITDEGRAMLGSQ